MKSLIATLAVLLALAFSSVSGEPADDLASAGGPLRPEIEEKKRVPKPKKEKEKKESDKKESKGSDCFGDCIGSVFESMLDSSSDDSEDKKAAKPDRAAPHAAEFVAFMGVIDPVDTDAETIEAWDRAGGGVLAGQVVGNLQRGTRVEVLERRVIGTIPWFKVRSYEPDEAVGWITYQNIMDEAARAHLADEISAAETFVSDEPIGEPSPVAEEPSEPTPVPVEVLIVPPPVPSWQILGEISWDVSGREDLRSEYLHGGVRTGAGIRAGDISSFQIGLTVTYTQANGDPQYNYKIFYDEAEAPPDSSRDIPRDSDLDILALGLQVGQYITTEEGPGFFAWGIGPTLFRVRERADISYVEFEDDNPVRSGERRDEMAEWKIGADVGIVIGYHIGDGASIGGTLGFSFIPWDGKQEESLTLDWIDSDHILLFHIGLTLGYSFFRD